MTDFQPVSTSSRHQGFSSDREMSLSQCRWEARGGGAGEAPSRVLEELRRPAGREDRPSVTEGAQGLIWGLHRLTSWGVCPSGRTLTATNSEWEAKGRECLRGEGIHKALNLAPSLQDRVYSRSLARCNQERKP